MRQQLEQEPGVLYQVLVVHLVMQPVRHQHSAERQELLIHYVGQLQIVLVQHPPMMW